MKKEKKKIADSSKTNLKDVGSSEAQIGFLSKKIENLTDKSIDIRSVYANGQTYGQDSPYHKDYQITVMVYLTVPWREDWGGEFRFLDTNLKSEDE